MQTDMQTDMQSDKGSTIRPPVEPAICNCLALRQAARHATQMYDCHLAPTGLKTTQYSILAKLDRLGPQSITALAAMMVMDRTTTTRAVRPLARDKLVSISPGKDERTRIVRITPAGEKRVKAAAARWRAAQEEFAAGYGAAAAERLRQELARVVEAV
ncbi:MAG TPA: MarR family transcriptional regulator [Xanthobacteraceae bacterium]|nr:MarR family transcriptional regulator [Xanthobacteraceae bacterium]